MGDTQDGTTMADMGRKVRPRIKPIAFQPRSSTFQRLENQNSRGHGMLEIDTQDRTITTKDTNSNKPIQTHMDEIRYLLHHIRQQTLLDIHSFSSLLASEPRHNVLRHTACHADHQHRTNQH